MQEEKHRSVGGPAKFFIISLSHTSLHAYYKTNFDLMQHHKYSLSELENMMPWEREIYVKMLIDHLRDEKERIDNERRKR